MLSSYDEVTRVGLSNMTRVLTTRKRPRDVQGGWEWCVHKLRKAKRCRLNRQGTDSALGARPAQGPSPNHSGPALKGQPAPPTHSPLHPHPEKMETQRVGGSTSEVSTDTGLGIA